VLKGAVVRGMKEDQNGHDLADSQTGDARSLLFPVAGWPEGRRNGP
jgi:hypothetical protein